MIFFRSGSENNWKVADPDLKKIIPDPSTTLDKSQDPGSLNIPDLPHWLLVPERTCQHHPLSNQRSLPSRAGKCSYAPVCKKQKQLRASCGFGQEQKKNRQQMIGLFDIWFGNQNEKWSKYKWWYLLTVQLYEPRFVLGKKGRKKRMRKYHELFILSYAQPKEPALISPWPSEIIIRFRRILYPMLNQKSQL